MRGPTARSASAPVQAAPAHDRPPIRFDRHEVSGAFGDLGTDLPLVVGMIVAAQLDASTVFLVFGALQIATGLLYRLPMPVQPLKAVAAIVIAQGIDAGALAAGGLAIGVIMFILAASGTLEGVARVVPKAIVRGIQAGLGLQLGLLALQRFVPQEGAPGFVLAAIAFLIALALLGNRRVPPAVVLVLIGLVWAAITWPAGAANPWAVRAPHVAPIWPTQQQLVQGLLLLALPQLALSLGNSVLATRQIVMDLFPQRRAPSVTKIGLTYAAMNLIASPIGGIPVCHGSGGMAGHYTFGGRTGGSVVLYGTFFIVSGLLLSGNPESFARLFPPAILGVLLVFEGVALLALLRDLMSDTRALRTALFCALAAVTLPYGYAVALVGGTIIWHLMVRIARP
jgi:hypothetical protein